MGDFYVLDDNKQLIPADAETWARFFADLDSCRVAFTDLAPGITVSTVFLGLDHRFLGDGPPIVFESMAFDDYGGNETRRYCTWSEAMCGHIDMVEELQEKLAVHAAES